MRAAGLRGGLLDVTCDLVVFDLDGTVFDSHAVMEHAFRAAFAKAQPRSAVIPFDELRNRQGRPFVDICGELGWPSTLPELFQQESRKRIDSVELFRDAVTLIRFLNTAGVPLGVLTGKDRLRSEELLDHFNLTPYFRWLVCGDDPFAGKPSPAGLQHLIDVSGARPTATYYIGDAPADRRCAIQAGVNFLGVEWPRQPQQLRHAQRCRISSSGADLLDFFRG